MGASSSCCFCSAKAEESPCAENSKVAELEIVGAEGASTPGRSEYITKAEASPSTVVAESAAMTVEGADGASTSGRMEYYSKRCEAMKRNRGRFSDDVAMEIEFSKSHWSELSRRKVAPQSDNELDDESDDEEEVNPENRELLKELVEQYPDLFQYDLDCYVLDRKIAEGGQAKIYEVVGHPNFLMKVFKKPISLQELPLPVLKEDVRQCIHFASILEDGKFAFLMQKCWGDLRKLIDQAMLEKNVNGIQGPPFPYKWMHSKRWTFYPVDFMSGIARHMRDLHERGVTHRDLKAANVLLRGKFDIIVADFECSIGVLGSGFWRAPEILVDPGNARNMTNEQWKKADVYSYGMTCFEIVTGQIPFKDEFENSKASRQLVIEGRRPKLPSDLDDVVKDLITKCWEPNPNLRPTFSEIVAMVKSIST